MCKPVSLRTGAATGTSDHTTTHPGRGGGTSRCHDSGAHSGAHACVGRYPGVSLADSLYPRLISFVPPGHHRSTRPRKDLGRSFKIRLGSESRGGKKFAQAMLSSGVSGRAPSCSMYASEPTSGSWFSLEFAVNSMGTPKGCLQVAHTSNSNSTSPPVQSR